MTAPVTDDDIVSGAVSYLLAQPAAVSAVDRFQIGGRYVPGIFQYRPWAKLEGSSKTACVITYEGGWAAPNIQNTLRFPRIMVHIWADPIRDDQHNVLDPGEVMRRANAAFRGIDAFLHRTAGAEVMFGQLRVINSVRLTEPVIYAVPDGDGLIRCAATYAITEG